jgi:hypothetical protein
MAKSIVIRGAPKARPWRLAALVAVFATLAAISASSAGAAAMNCQQQGYCYWGYNYVGVNVNPTVVGNWNYWFDQYLSKNSGDWITHGFESQSTNGCIEHKTGAVTWYGHPADTGTGCGGYIRPYVQWYSGNTSYLYFDDVT